MQVRMINLNCEANEYKFDMSAITEQEWIDMARDICWENKEYAKALTLNGVKNVVRDNKSKFKVFYQDSSWHELEYRLDVFGRSSRNYQDFVSKLFQDIMAKHYGEEYLMALDAKLAEINPIIKE